LADVVEVKTGSRSTAHWSSDFIRLNGWLILFQGATGCSTLLLLHCAVDHPSWHRRHRSKLGRQQYDGENQPIRERLVMASVDGQRDVQPLMTFHWCTRRDSEQLLPRCLLVTRCLCW